MTSVAAAIGFNLVPTFLLWTAIYTTIRFTGRKLSGNYQGITLLLILIITSCITGVLQSSGKQTFGLTFFVGAIVSIIIFGSFKEKLQE